LTESDMLKLALLAWISYVTHLYIQI